MSMGDGHNLFILRGGKVEAMMLRVRVGVVLVCKEVEYFVGRHRDAIGWLILLIIRAIKEIYDKPLIRVGSLSTS